MRSFLKIFLATFLALVVFSFIAFFFIVGAAGRVAAGNKPKAEAKTVLVLDLSQHFAEQMKQDIFSVMSSEANVPGLYDIIRLLRKAKADKDVAGLYILANGNANGFASSEEIRHAILDFKASGKFVLAYGDMMSQRSYGLANIADKIYLSPQGSLQWSGYSIDYLFLKGTLDKLEIEPQIFYAGKFKSATEALRTDRMTEANRLQTTVWLNELYDNLLLSTSEARKIDTATLRRLANEGSIRYAEDAVTAGLADGIKYDDEVKDEIKERLSLSKYEKINFLAMASYRQAVDYTPSKGEKIALIYAEGDIIDGKGGQGTIGSETYRSLVRKARLDKSIKAIVFRINSGGGSTLASETIWRELAIAKKEKPVVVSFGDMAASGGYYIACDADSIFALPTTITGSIGVFGIIPNMEKFFRNKLGVTFDGVQTGPYANLGTVSRPLTAKEKERMQADVDRIYSLFKQRVAEGRKKDTAAVEEIAQGRVWTGIRARELGLVDRFGGLQDAVLSAARMADLGSSFQVREFPEPVSIFDQLFNNKKEPAAYMQILKQEMGEENFKIYQQVKKIKEIGNAIQARLPFDFFIR